MDESQLIEAVRYSAGIKTDDRDFGDDRIRRELNDALSRTFSRVIVGSTEGYWKHCRTYPITSGTADYRIFHRASVGGLIAVEVRESSTSEFRAITRASQREAASFESDTGEPTHYQEFHDYLRLYPSPTVSGWSLRLWFYLRPSLLVEKQPTADYGYVESFVVADREIVITDPPFDRVLDAPIAIPEVENAARLIDVVTSDGIHALHVIEATATFVEGVDNWTLTLAATNADGSTLDMSRVQVGDYVRVAQQTDWPPLPQEFHRALADAAAAAIVSRQGANDRARILMEAVQADLQRMQDMIDPRIKEGHRWLKHNHGPLARRRNRWLT